jgi:hypothetical protein
MYKRKRTRSFHADKLYCQRLPILLTLALALLLCVAAFSYPPLAHAGSNANAIIYWDSTMLVPGQSSSNPEGPPDEMATAHGQNFSPNQQLDLVLVSGNINNNPAVCYANQTSVRNVKTTASGTFETSFIWPTSLNQPNQQYSICAITPNHISANTKDGNGPFTVLTANPPAISVSSTSISAGNTITVTGENWVPPQQVDVAVTLGQGQSSIATASVTSNGLSSGTFTATLTIPANAASGNYIVTASTPNNLLSLAYTNGTQALTVTGSATPTVTTTPTVTPTATSTPTSSQTPSATQTAIANGLNGNSSSGGNNVLIFALLIVLAVVILGIGGVLVFILAQRKNRLTSAGQFQSYAGSGTPGMLLGQGPLGEPPNTMSQAAQGANEACVRCNSPLPANSLVCGVCGLHNGLISDPDGPTLAF